VKKAKTLTGQEQEDTVDDISVWGAKGICESLA
jgi:hypothetical protein